MPEKNEPSHEAASWMDPTAQVATNLLTALATALGGPEASMAATSASPLVTRAFETLGGRFEGQRRRSGQAVLQAAVEESGLGAEELEARAADNPQNLLLAGMALDVGCRTVHADKIRALGRALSAGLTDDARVDLEQLAVAALADMEAPHVKVLRHIAEEPPRDQCWTADDLSNALPGLGPALGPVLTTLQRHALVIANDRLDESMRRLERERVRNAPTGVSFASAREARYESLEPWYLMSDFGEHVLALLRTAVPQDDFS